MAKEFAKAIGTAALETTLQAFLPEIMKKLDGLQAQVVDLRRDMDSKFAEVYLKFDEIGGRFEEVAEKFERTQFLINELGLRINTVDTRVVDFRDMVRDTSNKMDDFRERLVRVEVSQSSRRKRAS